MLDKVVKRQRRHRRVRAKIKGTKDIPRLCVFRSSNHIYAQLIDDNDGVILASANDIGVKEQGIKAAHQVGQSIAKKAMEKSISKVVFDRGGYKYHGRVKEVAVAAREGGLKF